GREGGYKLARPAQQISIYDILGSFRELEDDTKCVLGIGECDGNNKCALHDQWIEPRDLIRKMYKDTTLDKLEGQDFKM
ncbi:MAG: Rrf2 family transcriptional regulator, partial [Halarcobacter sp.]